MLSQSNQRSSKSWLNLLESSLSNNAQLPESRFLQLATLSESGLPDNRTVVFRGFHESNQLIIVTDTRSEKWRQLERNNNTSVCWYFSKTREQYRIGGSVELISQMSPLWKTLGVQQWMALSEAGRHQFLWGEPKRPRAENESLSIVDPVNADRPPEHFALLLVKASQVEYLTLRGQPQTRLCFSIGDDGWQCLSVIP